MKKMINTSAGAIIVRLRLKYDSRLKAVSRMGTGLLSRPALKGHLFDPVGLKHENENNDGRLEDQGELDRYRPGQQSGNEGLNNQSPHHRSGKTVSAAGHAGAPDNDCQDGFELNPESNKGGVGALHVGGEYNPGHPGADPCDHIDQNPH